MSRAVLITLVSLVAATAIAAPAPRVANPGTPDAALVIGGRVIQLEYWRCIANPAATWFEDGSAIC